MNTIELLEKIDQANEAAIPTPTEYVALVKKDCAAGLNETEIARLHTVAQGLGISIAQIAQDVETVRTYADKSKIVGKLSAKRTASDTDLELLAIHRQHGNRLELPITFKKQVGHLVPIESELTWKYQKMENELEAKISGRAFVATGRSYGGGEDEAKKLRAQMEEELAQVRRDKVADLKALRLAMSGELEGKVWPIPEIALALPPQGMMNIPMDCFEWREIPGQPGFEELRDRVFAVFNAQQESNRQWEADAPRREAAYREREAR